ncbi:MAG: hypothetical protein JWO19_4328 [Bryobacterales bacterium]|nr:hypothetical protein [Bryobacterales bacterium]
MLESYSVISTGFLVITGVGFLVGAYYAARCDPTEYRWAHAWTILLMILAVTFLILALEPVLGRFY